MRFRCKCGKIVGENNGFFHCSCGASTPVVDFLDKLAVSTRKKYNAGKLKFEGDTYEKPPKTEEIATLKPQSNTKMIKPTRPERKEPKKGGCGACQKKKMPSWAKMASNFASTMAEFATSGFKIADKELYEERINICKECPSFTDSERCVECGCFMKAKAGIMEAKCPLNKWKK
jgi:hypothetical protein